MAVTPTRVAAFINTTALYNEGGPYEGSGAFQDLLQYKQITLY